MICDTTDGEGGDPGDGTGGDGTGGDGDGTGGKAGGNRLTCVWFRDNSTVISGSKDQKLLRVGPAELTTSATHTFGINCTDSFGYDVCERQAPPPAAFASSLIFQVSAVLFINPHGSNAKL